MLGIFASLLFLFIPTSWATSADSKLKASTEIEAKYPTSGWKIIGFCGPQHEPLMEMRVPRFLHWDPNCEYHTVKDGIEYCGPDESSPRLTGSIEVSGRTRVLQVGMEAFWYKKPSHVNGQRNPFVHWEANDALLSKKGILLDGHEAYQGEIENKSGKLPPTAIQSETLIKFERPYLGGMLYFIESERRRGSSHPVFHADRVFQNVVDQIISSFRFRVPVEDRDKYPAKARDAKKDKVSAMTK